MPALYKMATELPDGGEHGWDESKDVLEGYRTPQQAFYLGCVQLVADSGHSTHIVYLATSTANMIITPLMKGHHQTLLSPRNLDYHLLTHSL